MTAFQTLGELGGYLASREQRPYLNVVDPGVPLLDAALFGNAVWGKQPSVRKVVDFIARNVASIPLHVFERVSDSDRRRVTDHELAEVAKNPTGVPGRTPFRFWHALLIDGLIHDRWCALKVVQDGRMRLHRLPPRRYSFEANYLDEIVGVKLYDKNGVGKVHDPESFVFDVGYAESGASGTSPMETIAHLLAEATESVEYRRSVWKNGARVSTVLERPAGVTWQSDAARDRFVAGWQAFTRGGNREGGTPILEDGMTLKEVAAFNPKETLDLEGRKLTDIEVASIYHIAPELVGARQGNYSNVDAFRQMLYGPALGPYIDAWQQAINASLTPDLAGDRNLYVEAHVESKLRGSFLEQASAASTATGRPWMTTNEHRSRMNLPPLDGGDELITPLNVLVGGQAAPTSPTEVPAPDDA